MATKGYGSYRGRSRLRTFLMVLIGALLVLLVLLLAAFFILEPHIIYSADGIRVDLSFLQGKGGGETPGVPESAPPLDLATPEPTLAPTPEPAPVFHGVLLPAAALYDGTARSQMDAVGGNAVIFDMKPDEGTLAYISELPLAVDAGACAEDGAINAAIRLLNTEEELYTVARVSCFRDNTVPRRNMALALRSSAGNWRDGGNYRWLNAVNPQARAYVVGVCVELAQLGFDELLLDNCAFPTQGRINTIRANEGYSAEALVPSAEAFFEELESALADYPEIKISVMSSGGVLGGTGEDSSGQTPELLAQYAWRVWTPEGLEQEEAYAAELARLGVERERLVCAAGEVRPVERSWAVWE